MARRRGKPRTSLRMTAVQEEAVVRLLRSARTFARFYAKHQRTLPAADRRTLRRFAAHMPQTRDLTLAVLKGHLLIEEMLTEVIMSMLPHPEFFDVRAGFERKLALTGGLSWDQQNCHIWDLILTLNSLRNVVAHNLESSKLHQKLSRFRGMYLTRFPHDVALTDDELITGAIGYCMGFCRAGSARQRSSTVGLRHSRASRSPTIRCFERSPQNWCG